MTIGSSSTYYNLLSNNIGSLLGTSSTSSTSSLTDLLGSISSSKTYGKSTSASAEDKKTAEEIGGLKSGADDLKSSLGALQNGGFKDTKDAVSKLQKFADSYNSLFDTAKGIASDDGNSKLATQMVNASKTYAKSLEGLGISFDEEGKMAVNSGKATEAAESGKLQSFFSEGKGLSYGFTNQIGKIASNVSRNTASYANKAAANGGVGYNSSGSTLSGIFGNSNFSGSLLNLLL